MLHTQPKLFIQRMMIIMVEAGELAVKSQKNIKNIGKEFENLPQDQLFDQKKRGAKTEIDEKVQELLLAEIIKILDPKQVRLDAEEETSLKKLFNPEGEITLVIDPIDGTLDYIDGKDSYSICVCLIKGGVMLTALVYFPSKDIFYFIDEEGSPCVLEQATSGFQQITIIQPPKDQFSKSLYRNMRVDSKVFDLLTAKGYRIYDDSENKIRWHDAILRCLSGEYLAAILHTPQIRDVMMGAILANVSNGYAVDWKGNSLKWLNGGRMPGIIFGFGECPKEVLDCLKV